MPVYAEKGLFHVFENWSSTNLQICSGFDGFKASGSNDSGQFWKATGLENRKMAPVPTDVKRWSVDAGNGPPCCMEAHTSTPVGTPL